MCPAKRNESSDTYSFGATESRNKVVQAYPSLSSICPKPPPRPTVALACLRVIQRVLMLAGIALIALPVLSSAAAPAQDLTQKSLEDLMSIEVTSVSKRKQKTSQVAAAVFVISREDISRSGALNIPDLLRMVPGLDVAQIDASTWAISARGFNGQYSDKLLVLIDGRTVYTPIFAGVFWDSQNVPLDTIERIEVIRGPGAAVWGSNAVNGVINIITRSATDTQGGHVDAGAGTISHRAGEHSLRREGRRSRSLSCLCGRLPLRQSAHL